MKRHCFFVLTGFALLMCNTYGIIWKNNGSAEIDGIKFE